MMPAHNIYRIVNRINGHCYIGQTSDPNQRHYQHVYQLAKRCHNNPKLQAAFNRYGPENLVFEILQCDIPTDAIDALEMAYIEQYDSLKNGYNLSPGGNQWRSIPHMETEAQQRVKTLLYVSVMHSQRRAFAEQLEAYGLTEQAETITRVMLAVFRQRRLMRADYWLAGGEIVERFHACVARYPDLSNDLIVHCRLTHPGANREPLAIVKRVVRLMGLALRKETHPPKNTPANEHRYSLEPDSLAHMQHMSNSLPARQQAG